MPFVEGIERSREDEPTRCRYQRIVADRDRGPLACEQLSPGGGRDDGVAGHTLARQQAGSESWSAVGGQAAALGEQVERDGRRQTLFVVPRTGVFREHEFRDVGCPEGLHGRGDPMAATLRPGGFQAGGHGESDGPRPGRGQLLAIGTAGIEHAGPLPGGCGQPAGRPRGAV